MRGTTLAAAAALILALVTACSAAPATTAAPTSSPAQAPARAPASSLAPASTPAPASTTTSANASPAVHDTPIPSGSPIDIGIVGATAYSYPPDQVTACSILSEEQVSAILYGPSKAFAGETIDVKGAHSQLCLYSAAGTKSNLSLEVVRPDTWNPDASLASGVKQNSSFTAGAIIARKLKLPGGASNAYGYTALDSGSTDIVIIRPHGSVLISTHLFGAVKHKPVNTAALTAAITTINAGTLG
jgi:hypothetical protein